jgi:hypothetical protein
MGQSLPEKKKTAFMPNICKNSISVEYTDNSVTIGVDKLDDIKPGDKVRILDVEKKDPFEAIVSSVKGNYFTIEGLSHEKYGDQVFVYGKEVNDFRTIDYDAVGLLTFNTTKKLTKQVEDQKVQIETLQKEVESLHVTMDKMMVVLQEQSNMIVKLKEDLKNNTTTGKGEASQQKTGASGFVPSTEASSLATGNYFTIERISNPLFASVLEYGKLVTTFESEGL